MNKKPNFNSNTFSVDENKKQEKNKESLLRKTLNTLFISEYEQSIIKS